MSQNTLFRKHQIQRKYFCGEKNFRQKKFVNKNFHKNNFSKKKIRKKL